ncbi:CbtA family protein [Mycobacterium spongiae]|uniref:Cobalt transporter n=1 Tax=Mycobacterium spongiae TaxID=886343 RepID=A0A975K0N5_9MYCO|nr:CbtA family protein [Mycobacterium spongiae]QUR69172.1 cobalt transporter [Mycobacterium spongiae]
MEKRLIARGVLAGAMGAMLAFVFARLVAEPVIGRAIEFEDGRTEVAHAQGVHDHGIELFSRGVQANAGLGFGVLVFGVALGALFAVSFCLIYGVYGPTKGVTARALSIRLAAGAFAVVYLVPFVKYPPNPPAVGRADSIGSRTVWYLVMVLASVVLALGALWLAGRLAARLGAWNAGLTAVGAYVAVIAVVMVVLPTVSETPGPLRDASGVIIYRGFPADVLYDFRLVSLGTQAVLWATIGLVFGMLTGRLLGERADAGRAASIAA